MVRATTGGVLRSYRKNLMSSFIANNKARDTVLSQRNFNSYAEDPATAAKAFRLRMSRLEVKSQYDVCENTYYKFQSAFSCLQSIDELIDTEDGNSLQTLKSTTLKMLNDPTGDARTQLSKALSVMSETIVQNLNQKYGDNFIFAGADGQNVPFEVKQVDGKNQLYYRGVPVDAAEPSIVNGPDGKPIECDANGVPRDGGDYYLKAEDISVIKADDYPADYGIYTVNTDPSASAGVKANAYTAPQFFDFVQFNEDGTAYNGVNGTGGYLALLTTAVATPVSDLESGTATIPREDLISISHYEDFCRSIDKDMIHMPNWAPREGDTLPNVLRDSSGKPVPVANPNGGSSDSTRAAGEYYLVLTGGDTTGQVIKKTDYDQACQDAEKLDYLVKEKRFVDIGLGFKEADGKLIESSGFNEALHGLTFLGYGLDEDGDPKNIYSIVQRLTELADSVSDGADWSDELYDKFDALVGKLEAASSEYKTQFTNMDAGTLKLKNNLDLLEDNFYSLDEQTSNLEDVDMVDAITSFIWAEYCYNAALKVGNSILSQSLMDYMN